MAKGGTFKHRFHHEIAVKVLLDVKPLPRLTLVGRGRACEANVDNPFVRFLIKREAGVESQSIAYTGDNPLGYVISLKSYGADT